MSTDSRRLGVLLMTYGSPHDLDDMPRYLTAVRGGRPPSPEVIAEFRRQLQSPAAREAYLSVLDL